MLLGGRAIDKLFAHRGKEPCAIREFIRIDLDHFSGVYEASGRRER